MPNSRSDQLVGDEPVGGYAVRPVTFSVVTIVLNNREGLERTARSVVAQRDMDVEWIVIDGGSTDGTLDVIADYSESIAYWHSRKDGGIYDAMNQGLSRATADYVGFLNSGDSFASEDSLSIASESIANLQQRPAMILGGAVFEYPHGHHVMQKPRSVEKYIRHSNPTSHQAIYFERQLHQQVPYDTSYRIVGDYDCICRVYLRDQNCVYIDDALVVAQRGGDSFSHRHPLRHGAECIRVQRAVLRMGYGSILQSTIRRARSYIAEYLMSRRRLAAVTWPVIRAVRSTAD